jgi:DNA-binding NtrC family response regulator
MLPDGLTQDLPQGASLPGAPLRAPAETVDDLASLLDLPLAEVERTIVLANLARQGGSVPRAARVLQLSPSTLYRKLEGWAKSAS